jgi:hypothetical protein
MMSKTVSVVFELVSAFAAYQTADRHSPPWKDAGLSVRRLCLELGDRVLRELAREYWPESAKTKRKGG